MKSRIYIMLYVCKFLYNPRRFNFFFLIDFLQTYNFLASVNKLAGKEIPVTQNMNGSLRLFTMFELPKSSPNYCHL